MSLSDWGLSEKVLLYVNQQFRDDLILSQSLELHSWELLSLIKIAILLEVCYIRYRKLIVYLSL